MGRVVVALGPFCCALLGWVLSTPRPRVAATRAPTITSDDARLLASHTNMRVSTPFSKRFTADMTVFPFADEWSCSLHYTTVHGSRSIPLTAGRSAVLRRPAPSRNALLHYTLP